MHRRRNTGFRANGISEAFGAIGSIGSGLGSIGYGLGSITAGAAGLGWEGAKVGFEGAKLGAKVGWEGAKIAAPVVKLGGKAGWEAAKLGGKAGVYLGKGLVNEVDNGTSKWGDGVFFGYDMLSYWKMRFVDAVLSLIDKEDATNPYMLWFIDAALQYLGQGDYMTFFSIFAGVLALRNVHHFVTFADLQNLLPGGEQVVPREFAREFPRETVYNARYVGRSRRRRRHR
jgi:hypothetical protein